MRARREKKRGADARAAAVDARARLEAALKEQRALARRLGLAEAAGGGRPRTASATVAGAGRPSSPAATAGRVEEEFWSEEAGRRFAAQQEELVALRERVAGLQAELDGARGVCTH
jgi:hypothetical protein